MRHALMFSVILIGCKTKQTDALDAFLAAECRLLTDPECIDSQQGVRGAGLGAQEKREGEGGFHRQVSSIVLVMTAQSPTL